MTVTNQYLRRASLIVAGITQAIELAELRIRFNVSQSDFETPNTALIRVYNLSEATERNLSESKEFTRVILQAGYVDGNFGTIFDGTIKQFRRGRENPTDTYFDILAADGDISYNFGVVNTTLAAGATKQDQINAAIAAANTVIAQPIQLGYVPDFGANSLPRGKVLYGLARDVFRTVADSHQTTWSLQNGKLVMIPQTSYLPGDVIAINSRTGMIGIPEQTDEGIRARCLLNPKLVVGRRVQINNADINRALFSTQFVAINQPPSIAADGIYKMLVVEHEGDTRNNEWYTNLVCLTVNPSVPADQSVRPFGS